MSFLYYVSHDLRTPLAGMKAYLETLELKQDSMPLAERQKFLNNIIKNDDQLESMINELFEFIRIESNQIEVKVIEFVIGDLLSDICSSLESKAQKQKVKLKINCHNHQQLIFGDIGKVERGIQSYIKRY